MKGADFYGDDEYKEIECDVIGGADFCFTYTVETGLKGHARGCATPSLLDELKFGLTEAGCKRLVKERETATLCLCEGDLCNAE